VVGLQPPLSLLCRTVGAGAAVGRGLVGISSLTESRTVSKFKLSVRPDLIRAPEKSLLPTKWATCRGGLTPPPWPTRNDRGPSLRHRGRPNQLVAADRPRILSTRGVLRQQRGRQLNSVVMRRRFLGC
jgi:hypothetical protein